MEEIVSAPDIDELIDAFRSKIEGCWSIPAGARDAINLVVTLRIFLNPDGSLARAPEVTDKERIGTRGQEFFRIAAESAIRAVHKCAPYEMLPAEKYETWRDIKLTFDPRNIG